MGAAIAINFLGGSVRHTRDEPAVNVTRGMCAG